MIMTGSIFNFYLELVLYIRTCIYTLLMSWVQSTCMFMAACAHVHVCICLCTIIIPGVKHFQEWLKGGVQRSGHTLHQEWVTTEQSLLYSQIELECPVWAGINVIPNNSTYM